MAGNQQFQRLTNMDKHNLTLPKHTPIDKLLTNNWKKGQKQKPDEYRWNDIKQAI